MINKIFEKISFTKKQTLNILVFVMLFYFIFHSIYGSRGILAYFKLQAEIQSSSSKLSELRAQRLELENKTKLLRPESLDLDMLDEKAREVLGVSAPNEKIFKTNK